MPRKKQTVKKNDSKYRFISTVNLELGSNTHEANKTFSVGQEMAEFLMLSNFYKNGTIKRVED